MVSPSPSYTSIPLIVRLWKDPQSGDDSSTNPWKGHRICLVNDTNDLDIYNFDNCTSAIEIIPGPNYDPNVDYKVIFYGEKDFKKGHGGAELELGIGKYPNLEHPHNFDDMISSVKFPDVQHSQINSDVGEIAIVAELYEHPGFEGKKLIVLLGDQQYNIPNLADYEFDRNFLGFESKIVSSVEVFKGPNYTDGKFLKLYRNKDYKGGHIDLFPSVPPHTNGEYGDLRDYGFDNEALSVKIADRNKVASLVG